MKTLLVALTTVFFALLPLTSWAQDIRGTWQLVKQSECISSELPEESETEAELVSDMKSRSNQTATIIRLRDKGAGEQAGRVLGRKKTKDNRNFLYRFDGDNLHILDKKSRTLTDTYLVEKITRDSLILSDASRPCDLKILLRIRDPKTK